MPLKVQNSIQVCFEQAVRWVSENAGSYPTKDCKVSLDKLTTVDSLYRSRKDHLKHFEISVLRPITFAELRKIPIEQPNFTNEPVI